MDSIKLFRSIHQSDQQGIKIYTHYGKRPVCRVSKLLPCANFRAHGKRTVCRVSSKKHTVNYLPCAQIWGTRQTTPPPTNPPTHTLNRHHLPTSPPSDPPPPPPGLHSCLVTSPPLLFSVAKMASHAIFEYNILVIDIDNTTLGLI